MGREWLGKKVYDGISLIEYLFASQGWVSQQKMPVTFGRYMDGS